MKVFQIDAFTTKKFEGNPAGVVLDAQTLTTKQMQQIARELNNSETAFLLPPDDDSHDVHIRYFTPTVEVPVCGHATISAHFVRAIEFGLTNVKVKQKCGVGILDIEVVDSKVFMTQKQAQFYEIETFPVLNALGLNKEDLTGEIEVVDTGNPKIMVPIKSKELLNSLKPNMLALSELPYPGTYVFWKDLDHPEIQAHGRMFAPALGIPEDPVTGNANGPLGAYLNKHMLIKPKENGWCQLRAQQGEAIGRPGVVEIFVQPETNTVRIAGEAVVCFLTEI